MRYQDRERNWRCVADLLRTRGVSTVEPYSAVGSDLHAEATFDQIRPVLELALVHAVEPGCRTKDSCLDCEGLAEGVCRADPLCAVMGAVPIDPERSCIAGPFRFLGCTAGGKFYPAAIAFAADPSGACFQVGSGGTEGWDLQAAHCQPRKPPPFVPCAP